MIKHIYGDLISNLLNLVHFIIIIRHKRQTETTDRNTVVANKAVLISVFCVGSIAVRDNETLHHYNNKI